MSNWSPTQLHPNPSVRYPHYYARKLSFLTQGYRKLERVQVCEERRRWLKNGEGWNNIFILPVLWIRHDSTVQRWEEANRSIEGTLWCDKELLLASEDNLRHKKEGDALFPLLAWCPAPFSVRVINLCFSWCSVIRRKEKSETKQGWGTWLYYWKTWKVLWRSPDRTKGNLRMRAKYCNITGRHYRANRQLATSCIWSTLKESKLKEDD